MNKKPDDEVADLIQMTGLCETLGVLPYGGGLYDQPADLIDGMLAVLMAKNEKADKDRPKPARRGRHK